MIASQFNLDHRLAELREAGADSRLARARRASSQADRGAVRAFIDSIRSLLGGSSAGSRTVGLAPR